MNLNEWAIKWAVPFAAVEDLRRQFCDVPDAAAGGAVHTEAGALSAVRLEATRRGLRLWRNNVGAMQDVDGRVCRFGLANDSAKINAAIKSADLIGIRPVRIVPLHVGGVIGQFVAREVKAPGWTFSGTEREIAQLKFLELVAAMGGDAAFCTGEGTL